jgi:hypothetical protein
MDAINVNWLPLMQFLGLLTGAIMFCQPLMVLLKYYLTRSIARKNDDVISERLKNIGLQIAKMEQNIEKLFVRLDNQQCLVHATRMEELERRVAKIEEK